MGCFRLGAEEEHETRFSTRQNIAGDFWGIMGYGNVFHPTSKSVSLCIYLLSLCLCTSSGIQAGRRGLGFRWVVAVHLCIL